MKTRTLASGLAVPLLVALLAVPAAAQRRSVGAGFEFMGYSFDAALGTSSAQLYLAPVAVRLPLGQAFTLDLYSAWAQGWVERNNVAYELTGLVDTRVKATLQAAPWAILSVGASIPTGNATHTGEEALVASVLATDLLGFRETTWGTGTRITSSVATAVRAGSFGVGMAASYSVNGEFSPSTDTNLRYQPGDETRVRIGVDRNFGNSTLTLGGTFMTYQTDQADGRNLFQAGNRLRFDASYAFRAGAGVWTLYAADLWREHGDLTLGVVDQTGAQIGDTTFVTPSQNLFVGGLVGSIGIGRSYQFRPMLDVRVQKRDNAVDATGGSGWIAGVGGDLPVRLFGVWDFFPRGRFLFGFIEDPTGTTRKVTGAEFSGTVRWSF